MVIDGKDGKAYDGFPSAHYYPCFALAECGIPHNFMVNDILFSPDSKRHAYSARRGEKWLLVVDGEERVADDIEVVLFGPDSKHLITYRWIYYPYSDLRKGTLKIDNQVVFEYQGISAPVFASPERLNLAVLRKGELSLVEIEIPK